MYTIKIDMEGQQGERMLPTHTRTPSLRGHGFGNPCRAWSGPVVRARARDDARVDGAQDEMGRNEARPQWKEAPFPEIGERP